MASNPPARPAASLGSWIRRSARGAAPGGRLRLPAPAASSAATVAAALLLAIAAGTIVLAMPVAAANGSATGIVTALFTATSAVCTTGLVVVDTRDHWSPLGEIVILVLMQIGGLGFLVNSTVLLLVIGRRLSLRDRLLVREALGEGTLGGVAALVRRIVVFALAVEAAGAVLLTGRFLLSESPPVALWYGVFHAVSAFTNASFDLFGDMESFSGQRNDPFLLLVVSALIILGGISYSVVADVCAKRRFRRLSLDTKLVLVTTAVLLAAGTAGFLGLEFNNPNTLAQSSGAQTLLQSFFFSVASRTSGFAPVAVGALREETLFFLTGLMFIGGAAGSTAGGIKVNSLAVLAVVILSAAKGREQIVAFGREIPAGVAMRALTVATLALAIVFVATLGLMIVEPFGFLPLLFETTSAFGTVGFSTGITPQLSVPGKLVLIGAMYIGRLGPLVLAMALTGRERPTRVRFPEDTVRIG